MNLSEFTLTEEEIRLLTPDVVSSCPSAIVILKMLKQVYDRDIKRLAEGAIGIDDELPRQDFRYTLGMTGLAQTLLEAPQEAKRYCSEN